MSDAIEFLQKKDGLWHLNGGMSERKYFDLEAAGKPSRWNK